MSCVKATPPLMGSCAPALCTPTLRPRRYWCCVLVAPALSSLGDETKSSGSAPVVEDVGDAPATAAKPMAP